MLSEKDNQAVLEILADELGVAPDQLTPDARLVDDLGADSLTIVEITMRIEDAFNLSIPDEQWEKVRSVGDLLGTLADLLNKQGR
ncbi:MAG TPA: acyl carrier protein [Candidatus Paceibacterota bacterium]|nr:acyl carrier protein [Candidatus Paceibacterota bacterium]